MNDNELLYLLRNEPQKGLAETVRIYSAYVMKIAYTKLGDVCTHEDIEETVSDIFMMFYTSGSKCGFKIRSVRAYISVIAERHCIDVFRKKCAGADTKNIPLEDAENLTAVIPTESGISSLAEAVHRLGEPDEFIFIRKYFFGQKSESIAGELNMKTNTVNKRISRGLKKLRKILEEDA